MEQHQERDAGRHTNDTGARFCFAELLPHLEVDELWLLDARQCAGGRLVAEVIRAEARAMTAVVYELVATTRPCEAVAATRVLHALLAAHALHEQLLVTSGGYRPAGG